MAETGRSSDGRQAGHLARFASLLRLLGGAAPRGEMLRDLLTHLRQWSGCEAVGIRLREGDDYPYYETCGFPVEFLRLENSLCPGSSGRLTSLLSDILDLSRIEAGRMPLVMGEFAVADLLASVRESFGPMCVEKGLALMLEADPATPGRLVGDELRVRQILLNLVGNAMKFSDKGEVRLHIRPLARARGMDARLLFQVSDQGIGIDEGQMQEIFEPFAQGRGGLARGHQGVGLGLAITKRLVDAMQGTLAYESEVGVGTTACVMLSFALPRRRAREREEGCQLPGREESGLAILLAEDDAVSQLGTRCLLERLGHTVAVAGTGAQALELLAEGTFDLVLMDVQMPELDGVEAVRRIRAHDQGLFDPGIPVVALTAYAMAGDRERLLRAGMSGYLAKPFELAELGRAIREAVRPGGGRT